MIDIREHGGNFGGSSKPPIRTATLVAAKTFTNPLGDVSLYGSYIDENNLEIFDRTANPRRKKINFNTLEITDYVSKNTYLNSDFNSYNYEFGEYFINVINGVNYINILDKDKNLVKTVTLGTINFTHVPVCVQNFNKEKMVITVQVDSYNGYYDVYILNKDLTVTTPTQKRLKNFVNSWCLTDNGYFIGHYAGYTSLYSKEGSLISDTMTESSTDTSCRILTPFRDGNSYLVSAYRNSASDMRDREVLRVVTVRNNAIKMELVIRNPTYTHASSLPICKFLTEKNTSILIVGLYSNDCISYSLDKKITKPLLTFSDIGYSNSGTIGYILFDYRNKSKKEFFALMQASSSTNQSYIIAKYITE